MSISQLRLDLRGRPSAGEALSRIRNDSRDQSEKGRWFEQLFMRIALQQPKFEVAEIWRWPEREDLTGLDGRDIEIDQVARRTNGEWIAIQCKCYDERHILAKAEIDKFLGGGVRGLGGDRLARGGDGGRAGAPHRAPEQRARVRPQAASSCMVARRPAAGCSGPNSRRWQIAT